MVSNYPLAVSKIVCIDLLNLSFQELQNYSLILPEIQKTKQYLKYLYSKLHADLLDENNQHLIYIENDFIIGSKRHEQSYKGFHLGEFEILQKNIITEVDSNLFLEIEKKLAQNKSLLLNPFLMECYKSAFKNPVEINPFSFSFVNAYIEVSNFLVLSPVEIFNTYNTGIYFFNNEAKTNNLVLKKMYYKNQYPLIFIFTDDQKMEYIGWNKHYLIALQNVKPINGLSIDNLVTLNEILDKINKVGLINLDEEEIGFLYYYSKL